MGSMIEYFAHRYEILRLTKRWRWSVALCMTALDNSFIVYSWILDLPFSLCHSP